MEAQIKSTHTRTIVAGIAGGFAMNVAMLFTQFGEPLRLIAIELIFWAVIALTDGFAISIIMERKVPTQHV